MKPNTTASDAITTKNIQAKFGDANVKSAQVAYDKVQKYSL